MLNLCFFFFLLFWICVNNVLNSFITDTILNIPTKGQIQQKNDFWQITLYQSNCFYNQMTCSVVDVFYLDLSKTFGYCLTLYPGSQSKDVLTVWTGKWMGNWPNHQCHRNDQGGSIQTSEIKILTSNTIWLKSTLFHSTLKIN